MTPRAYIAAAVLIATALAGFAVGWKFADHAALKREAAHQAEHAAALAERERQRAAAQLAVDQLAEQLETARAERIPRERVIIREVTRYAQTVPDARRCTLDGAWRLLHDAAATGVPPDTDPPGVAADRAAPIGDAPALETVADNYATCRDLADQVMGWQAWWRAIETARQSVPNPP